MLKLITNKRPYGSNMDINEIRRTNLLHIAKNVAKNKQTLAEKIETSPSYLSQMISESNKANVGDDIARRVEREYDLGHGWMDRTHDPAENSIEDQRKEYASLESQLTEDERANMIELMRLVVAKRNVLDKLL